MSSSTIPQVPFINGEKYLIGGEIRTWSGKFEAVYSPVTTINSQDQTQVKHHIGNYAFMTEKEAVEAVEAAVTAFDKGRGAWPGYSTEKKIECLEKFTEGLMAKREEIVNVLMWEICKNRSASEQEVDRTIQYIRDTIKELSKLETHQSNLISVGGISAQVKRSPLGVVLSIAPFNYPLNETYTTLIPALIMGNVVILKTPRTGGLCHTPTLELFRDCFPPGAVNVIHGSGRETLPPMMKTGLVDVLAFIGTHNAANALINSHPNTFKLRSVLGLDAKNAGFVLPEADVDTAVTECALGAFSFNGQRCTALKLLFVHESIVDEFVPKFCKAVDALKIGYPWESGVSITPLAEPQKPKILREYIKDATEKGAKIVNQRAQLFANDTETNPENRVDRGSSTLFAPTVLYPVTSDMKVYHEEQFGPITPIVSYSSLKELEDYIVSTTFGQQAAVFIKTDSGVAVDSEYFIPLVDLLTHHVSRININCQCQRGPDSFPFTGRKDSATGTLSIYDALRAMSIRALVATKESGKNVEMVKEIIGSGKSNFLREYKQ